jgi:hypothetical protein
LDQEKLFMQSTDSPDFANLPPAQAQVVATLAQGRTGTCCANAKAAEGAAA